MAGDEDLLRDFKLAMRRLAATISLVTTVDEAGELHGMAATALASVSTDPPSLLICVNRQASLHEPLSAVQRFCVNLLHREHASIVGIFSDPQHRARRFEGPDWYPGRDGLPALKGAQASIFCTLDKAIPYGSHSICIGLVNEVACRREIEPLIYSNATFRSVGPPLQAGESPDALDLVF